MPVAGQAYLQKVASPLAGVLYAFTIQEDHESTDTVLKRVLVRLMH